MGTFHLLPLLIASALQPAGDIGPMNTTISPNAPFQEGPVGTWTGTLEVPGGQLPMVIHIQAGEDGSLTATMDSPAQGAKGIPVSEVSFEDGHLRLFSEAVQGGFEGDLSQDGNQLAGTWRQSGMEFDLVLVKEGSTPEVEPTEAQRPIVGTWLGSLSLPGGGASLRMVFHINV